MSNDGLTPEVERKRVVKAQFAQDLQALRESVGNPSFRRMAGTSGYISHTTLHEAANGSRFPSWETTREFVKACGGDEAEWRTRWTTAKNGPPEPAAEPAAEPVSDRRPTVDGAEVAPVVEAPGKRSVPWPAVAAVFAVALIATGVTTYLLTRGGETELPATPAAPAPPGPLYPGDRTRFGGDITIPDETVVKPGEQFLKVWEIENAGSVMWSGRYLEKMDPQAPGNNCASPDRLPIGDTLPNERVKISVNVTASNEPGTCHVHWKMLDRDGKPVFPGSRPIYYLVNIKG